MTPDFAALLLAAQRCNSAYVEDLPSAKAAFAALGTFIGQYQNDDHQAVLSNQRAGRVTLTISGTRFSDGEANDLLDDVDDSPREIHPGVLVGRGAIRGLGQMWDWALGQVGSDVIFDVEGHSLGGWRTSYTPEFLPAGRIGTLTCLESPKPASQSYYEMHAEIFEGSTVSVVNERDLWFGYPFLERHFGQAPQKFIWLTGGSYRLITYAQWPGGRSIKAHGISSAVIPKLAAVAAQQAAA